MISGFVPPPEVAGRIDRWIRLAAEQIEREGWSRPLAAESPSTPRAGSRACSAIRPNHSGQNEAELRSRSGRPAIRDAWALPGPTRHQPDWSFPAVRNRILW